MNHENLHAQWLQPHPQMDSQISTNSPNKCRVGSQVHGHREAALVNGVLNEDLLDLLV